MHHHVDVCTANLMQTAHRCIYCEIDVFDEIDGHDEINGHDEIDVNDEMDVFDEMDVKCACRLHK